MSYAEGTTVPFDKSISEIITQVKRAGAREVGQLETIDAFAIQFALADRVIRFRIPLPQLDEAPRVNGRGQALSAAQRAERISQMKRQRGRALLLVIKAKIESVESRIETVEQAFLAQVVMKDGQTLYERVREPVALEYQTGRPDMVRGLLPPPRGGA